MSRSYRTRPRSVIADERMPRDGDGNIIFPRIVTRRPKTGDIHPLDKRAIAVAYKRLPLEYFYGLKEIVLMPRNGEVGQPFGKYSPHSKQIVLYSVPASNWVLESAPKSYLDHLKNNHASVSLEGCKAIIEWETPFLFIFFLNVLFHELGHHYIYQYKCKQKPPMDVYLNEWHADLQVSRIHKHTFRKRSS